MMTIVSRMPWITTVTLGWVLAMGMALAAPTRGAAGVTNLETGRSAIIAIRDRGPYVKGRIVDLSPATATQIVRHPSSHGPVPR